MPIQNFIEKKPLSIEIKIEKKLENGQENITLFREKPILYLKLKKI